MNPDDVFQSELYLFDYDGWVTQLREKHSRLQLMPWMLVLQAAEKHQIEVIRKLEARGYCFESPDFWVTRGEMARLADSGEWAQLMGRPHAAYPQAVW